MIKILVVTQPKETGLTYHRQTIPHTHLVANYSDFHVDYAIDISEATKENLQDYQIVCFLRLVSEKGKTETLINKCKEAGCKVVVDIDDYWFLHPTHELHKKYKENNISNQTISGLVNADWVTTTTEHFADKIKQHNKNVTVLPNSIDETQPQFKVSNTYSNRLRFGYIAGVYHVPDAKLMFNGMKEVHKTVRNDRYQFCLGGYGNNNTYNFMEYMFSNEYKALPKEYKEYLGEFTPEENFKGDSECYKRLWGKSVYEYATLYNEIDVALVPLVETSFNSFKSQIKIIEAGWFKKAVIVSNVMPYTIDCKKSNSILISPSKRGDGWGLAMKRLINNPNLVEDLGEAMHETVKEKYNMDTVNKVRADLYRKLCE